MSAAAPCHAPPPAAPLFPLPAAPPRPHRPPRRHRAGPGAQRAQRRGGRHTAPGGTARGRGGEGRGPGTARGADPDPRRGPRAAPRELTWGPRTPRRRRAALRGGSSGRCRGWRRICRRRPRCPWCGCRGAGCPRRCGSRYCRLGRGSRPLRTCRGRQWLRRCGAGARSAGGRAGAGPGRADGSAHAASPNRRFKMATAAPLALAARAAISLRGAVPPAPNGSNVALRLPPRPHSRACAALSKSSSSPVFHLRGSAKEAGAARGAPLPPAGTK